MNQTTKVALPKTYRDREPPLRRRLRLLRAATEQRRLHR